MAETKDERRTLNVEHRMMNEKQGSEEIISEISEVTGASGIFVSTGYSIIAVTRDGTKKLLKIPITTLGINDVLREFEANAPMPPVIVRLATDKEREAIGLEVRGQRAEIGDQEEPSIVNVQTYDLTDQKYVEALAQYGRDKMWRVVIGGMVIRYGRSASTDATAAEDKEGAYSNTPLRFEEKRKMLLANGLTDMHALRIYADILRLNKLQEDREVFLPKKQSA